MFGTLRKYQHTLAWWALGMAGNMGSLAVAGPPAPPAPSAPVVTASAAPTAGVPAPIAMTESRVIPASALSCDDGSCADEVFVDENCCGYGIGCSPIYASFEYLLWWEDKASYPALATTSPVGTVRDDAGVMGLNSTTVLFGGDQTPDHGALSGGRLSVGIWLDPMQCRGILARGFAIEDHDLQFVDSANGNSILARPFYNAFTDEEDALLLGFPNEIEGAIQIDTSTETRGAEALLRHAYHHGGNYRVDFIYGYRYLGVDDSLRIENTLEFTDPTVTTFGTTIDQVDMFDIDNEFHGGELGFIGHSVDGRWTLDFLMSVALGQMTQTATISGSTVTTPPGIPSFTSNGGLLTQNSNTGVFENDPFTVIPEGNITLGYFVTPKMDISVGYSFLFVSNVARAGDLVDRSVNLTQQTGTLEGPERPVVTFQDSSYWLQGLSFGLNLRY